MYTIYNDHKGWFCQVARTKRLVDAEDLAKVSAKRKYDAFYRVFSSEGFVIAWSILNGKIKRWNSVIIPKEHR